MCHGAHCKQEVINRTQLTSRLYLLFIYIYVHIHIIVFGYLALEFLRQTIKHNIVQHLVHAQFTCQTQDLHSQDTVAKVDRDNRCSWSLVLCSSAVEEIIISDDEEAMVRAAQMEEDESLAQSLQVGRFTC